MPKKQTNKTEHPVLKGTRNRKEAGYEGVLLLPPPHSKPQNNLINAWDLRYDPNDPHYNPSDPLNTSFYDPLHPEWESFPLTFPGLRFVVGACGSKFGKTYGCAIRLVKEAWETQTMNERNWWVAPTYAQAENAYFFIVSLLPPRSFREQVGKLRIILLNPDGTDRSMIEFKSGDEPGALRGFAVRFFIMDEVAQGMPEASYISILTTTTQTKGRGIFISTPNGAGWFYEIYQKGVKFYDDGTPRFSEDNPDPNPEWFSVRMPTHANPFVDLDEIALKRKQMPEAMFKQELLAMFVEDANAVFKEDKILSAFRRGKDIGIREPEVGHYYVMGVDLAKHRDYTVLTVMDRRTKHVVYHERFNKISWPFQKLRIIEVSKKYNNALIVLDANGIGDSIYDDLVDAGKAVQPYKLSSNEAKRLLIEKLMVSLENERISIPVGSKKHPSLHALLDELKVYAYQYTKDGRTVTYNAPSGKHDDTVISLALAVWVADVEIFQYKHRKIRGV